MGKRNLTYCDGCGADLDGRPSVTARAAGILTAEGAEIATVTELDFCSGEHLAAYVTQAAKDAGVELKPAQ